MFSRASFWKLIGVFGMLVALQSCELFSSKQQLIQQGLDEELQSINWEEVDQLPRFADCEETENKALQQECFEQTLSVHLAMALEAIQFRISESLEETVYVDFVVDAQGGLTIVSMEQSGAIKEQLPELEITISRSLKSLPRLQPALKRGIPVSTKFRLPLLIDSNAL